MKKILAVFLLLIVANSSLIAQSLNSTSSPREHLLMDRGWRFAFGHPSDFRKDFNHATGYFSYFAKTGYGDGAAAKDFDDRSWRTLDLPHDWAVELPFNSRGSHSHGYKTIGRNFPETSIGWYRKTFFIPGSDLGKRICIEFDGIFRNSTVWINGFYVGQEHSGYNGFRYDITDYLRYGDNNVVAVRVDATLEEGWFYEGAGIYRHVWLTKTTPLHLVPFGLFVTSNIKDNAVEITTHVTLIHEGTNKIVFELDQTILDTRGQPVATTTVSQLMLNPSETHDYSCLLKMTDPSLWSIDNPYLYKLITIVRSGESVIDRMETSFGIRTLRFDADDGFFLNGKHILLKGTNNHQDHAGVGTALPDALQEYRIKRLKAMGCNAYRCSHNPPTPELLDACDRLGILVIDENRLMGSSPEHLDLLKRLILRDRNHPCVFVWSIGNEEWAIEGNVTGERIATTMQAMVKRLDPTRWVTYANSGGWGNGISTVQEVMGFNYIFNGDIDRQHASFPDQPAIGTEETTSRGTRGIYEDDSLNAHMMAIDRRLGGHGIEGGMKFYAARPFLAGLFFWTGFDYRGEANPFGWPQVTSQCGILDLCGFPKDMFYYLQSWWSDEPVLHLFPHWTWPGKKGQTINVWAYSNCDEVELFLNQRSLGRKAMPKNGHLEWAVNYEPGALLARGYRNGNEVIKEQVETTGAPARIKLIPDRVTLRADGEDVSVITVQVNDMQERLVPTAGNEIIFDLKGAGRIIGVGNGDPSSHEPDRYFAPVRQLTIDNLKVQAISKTSEYPELGVNFDDSKWPSLLNDQSEYHVAGNDSSKMIVIRGTFDLPDLTNETEISLWPKSLGEDQAVYVNGHLIAKSIKRDDPVRKYILDHATLCQGKNVYALVGTSLVKRFQYDNLNTDPGIIQMVQPAAPWQRRVFNGLAQVIVQSTMEPGEIILTAISAGLTKSVVKIITRPTTPRPAVPEG